MTPATAATAPNRLTAALVASPANTRETPKAQTIGHAVEAGTSTVLGAFSASISDRTSTAMASFPQRPMT